MSDVHFILTGGTIDKTYNPITEKPEPHEISVIPNYIRDAIKPHKDISFETLCMKDSLEINQTDRKNIVRAIENATSQRIVVVHGTSTLEDTARYLESAINVENSKVIVVMGAMIPLKEFPRSDGGFNLGFTLGAIEALDAGVYVCMNAQIFMPQDVTKNTQTGRFTTKGAFNLHAC